jgi:hypothetical protein
MGGYRPVAPLEGIEQVREVAGVDADASVGDLDGQAPRAVGERADGDPSSLGGVSRRVGDQVPEHLLHTRRVAAHVVLDSRQLDRQMVALAPYLALADS